MTIAANGRQTVGATWLPGATSSTKPRWQTGAWTVDAAVSAFYAGVKYLFLGGGVTAAGASANTVEAMQVTSGGQLVAFIDAGVNDFSTNAAGYGTCAANGQLFTFGGGNASPTKKAKSAVLANPPPGFAPAAWNDEGLQMTHGRYLLGSAVQSSFIFLLGGQTDEPSPASKTTELVIW